MKQIVTSDFKLGIVAGGQLGKMLVLAASNWDVQTYVMDTVEDCPASGCCTVFMQGNPHNYDDVYRFGQTVDMITYEIESINTDALKKLKAEGKLIYPDPEVLEVIQDKGLQKQFYAKHQIPTSVFILVSGIDEIKEKVATKEIQFPFVQKLRKGGYDGRGVVVIKSQSEMDELLPGPSVIEDCIDIDKEISVIAARNKDGDIKCFSVVEMEFNPEANLVERLICPASIDTRHETKAVELATKLISLLDVVGIIAVEMFLDKDQTIWINEIAPRPHNSGHHTIESTITSQYEQLLRAIFNFPLGSTHIKIPSVMINLLGEPNEEGPVKYEGLKEAMAIDGVKIHLYGKKHTKPFRKMGHVTVLANTISEAVEKSEIVKQKLKVKSWQIQS